MVCQKYGMLGGNVKNINFEGLEDLYFLSIIFVKLEQ